MPSTPAKSASPIFSTSATPRCPNFPAARRYPKCDGVTPSRQKLLRTHLYSFSRGSARRHVSPRELGQSHLLVARPDGHSRQRELFFCLLRIFADLYIRRAL